MHVQVRGKDRGHLGIEDLHLLRAFVGFGPHDAFRGRQLVEEVGPRLGAVAVGVVGAEGDDEAVGRVAQDHLTVHRQRCAHERVHRCVDLAVGDLVIPIL